MRVYYLIMQKRHARALKEQKSYTRKFSYLHLKKIDTHSVFENTFSFITLATETVTREKSILNKIFDKEKKSNNIIKL